MPTAISLEGISKKHRIYSSQRDRLYEALSLGRVKRSRDFLALNDINLEIEQGTSLGLLGRNGAGKSTLLRIISGVLQPSSGFVRVDGRIAALLQLGAGFNPEFTGRENALLNGLFLGIDRKEMIRRFDEIEAFADLGEFMDQPVKTYSSGMRARLGFAVAVNVEPDVLLVDETLSVGDGVFKHMGIQKMRELQSSGATIVFVTHSTGMVKSFCTEAALLHKGNLLAHGDTSETVDRYQALLSNAASKEGNSDLDTTRLPDSEMDNEEPGTPEFEEDPKLESRPSRLRHGTGEARIQNVEMLNERGEQIETVMPESTTTVRIHVEYMEEVNASVIGFILRNKTGLDIFSTNTKHENAPIGKRRPGDRVIVDFSFQAPLRHGPYSIAAAVESGKKGAGPLDWIDVATALRIERPDTGGNVKALIHLPTKVKVFEAGESQKPRRSA
jgi:ABC-type polysaccharide/polyol phosphate transport system ATPase subunit